MLQYAKTLGQKDVTQEGDSQKNVRWSGLLVLIKSNLMLRGKSNARSDCKGPRPAELQKSSRNTRSHSVLKRHGLFTIIILIC